MKRMFVSLAAVIIALGAGPAISAQENLSEADLARLKAAEDVSAAMEQIFSSMEAARLRGDCERLNVLRQHTAWAIDLFGNDSLSSRMLSPAQVAEYTARLEEVARRSCTESPPVESVVGDVSTSIADVTVPGLNDAAARLRAIRDACRRGVPIEGRAFYLERYDRIQAMIRAARDEHRSVIVNMEGPKAELLREHARSYEALLEGLPQDFQCLPATVARSDEPAGVVTSTPLGPDARIAAGSDTPGDGTRVAQSGAAGGDLDWLLGAGRGGAIGFRQEADGTASGYVAELNDRARENGYAVGQVFLRGCRDISTSRNNQVAWTHSARCEESFNGRWEGPSIVSIPLGEDTLDIGYYALPITKDRPLSRSGS